MARNGVIGRGNRLPWHLPADLAHFKQRTLGKPLIMGRRTFESLPGLLPGREHLIVSRTLTHPPAGCQLANSPQTALDSVATAPEVMVIGGAALYRAFMPLATELHLTLIDAEIDGDTQFPPYNPNDWREISREQHPADARNPYALTFVSYQRLCPRA